MKRIAPGTSLSCLGLVFALAGCGAAEPTSIDAVPSTANAAAQPPPVSATPAAAPVRAATFLLPGDIVATTRLSDVRALYGAANVVEGEVPGAEGETAQGAILFPEEASRRAYLYLDGDRVQSVRVFDQPSSWKLDNGIGIGTPLSELVARNGKPIRFYGMEWDYGGTISDWGGGALAPVQRVGAAPDAGRTDQVFRRMSLTTREDIGDAKYPLGDGEFSSADKAYPTLGQDLVVGEIGVSFDDGSKDEDLPNGDTATAGADAR